MSPLLDAAFRVLGALLFVALVASVVADRRQGRRRRPVPAHDARRCMACTALRHPSNRETRTALASIPYQTRGEDQ